AVGRLDRDGVEHRGIDAGAAQRVRDLDEPRQRAQRAIGDERGALDAERAGAIADLGERTAAERDMRRVDRERGVAAGFERRELVAGHRGAFCHSAGVARFELGGETVEGWLEVEDGAIAFRTRRGDAITERARAPLSGRGDPEAGDLIGADDVRAMYAAF